MSISYTKLFQPLQLSGAAALVATVPAAPATTILLNGRIRAVNNTGAAVAVTVYAVPASGAAGITNILAPARSVAPTDWLDIDLPEMAAGDALWAFAGTANGITLHYMDGVLRA